MDPALFRSFAFDPWFELGLERVLRTDSGWRLEWLDGRVTTIEVRQVEGLTHKILRAA